MDLALSNNHNDVATARPGVGNAAFLAHVAQAAPLGSTLWVAHFAGNPGATSAWGGVPYRPDGAIEHAVDEWGHLNTYFSVGAVVPDTNGEVSRRKSNFARLLVLVVDDADPDAMTTAPSWVLHTSPGKHQVGFFLDGQDRDCADLGLVSALVTRMAKQGLIGGDLSGNNVIRYVRLPVGQNHKPRDGGHWDVRLSHWAPRVRYSLEDAAAAVGIDLDELKAERLASPQLGASGTGSVGGPQDVKLRALAVNILAGENLHDSINEFAASLVASGAHGGAVVNTLRAMMQASPALRDERWQDRFNDIGRSVATAEEKFRVRSASAPQVDPETGERPKLLVHVSELLQNLQGVEWLIEGWLEREGLSMMYGPSGSGKSFVAIDWACSVACGLPWHGAAVKQGPVIYVAGEGHHGLRRRLAAWQKARGMPLASAPLHLSKKAVKMLDAGAVLELSEEIDAVCREHNRGVALVVIDTLARNFGDGDENSTQDANRFIEAIDALRGRYQCNVLVIHHSGHLVGRARGASALKGALDQEIEIEGGALIKVSATKMKDAEAPEPRVFKLEQLLIGMSPASEDTDAEDVFGAVLQAVGDPLAVVVATNQAGKKITARDTLAVLADGWQSQEVIALSLVCGMRAAKNAVARCLELGYLQKSARDGSNGRGGNEVSEKGLRELSLGGHFLLNQPTTE